VAGSTLFVSPEKPGNHIDDQSEDELEFHALTSKERLATLIAEKRAERLAREAEEESNRLSSAHRSSDLPEEMIEGPEHGANPEIDRILSDAVKPTRKASKKALLDMERETQRMVRQQALAHQMKTKKKFTTNDLFAKFNYHPNGSPPSMAPPPPRSASSSAPNSDAIEDTAHEPASTPPSSPPTPLDRQKALVEQGALSKLVPVREDSLASLQELNDDEELPEMADIIRASGERKLAARQTIASPASEPKKGLKLARLGKKAMALPQEDSSDDELEIIRELPSHLSIFERAKGLQKRQHTDSKAIHILKHLSHIGADAGSSGRRNKNNARPSVHPQVLEAQLRLRAKEQARARQQERIAELKAKGIEIQTSEEREREAEEFENLLEKARQEAVDLRKAEKAADNEGKIVVSDDESEDEDYYDGSENEDDEREVAENSGNELVDDAADESEDEEDEEEEEVQTDEEVEEEVDELAQDAADLDDKDSESRDRTDAAPSWAQTPVLGRKPRKSHVILDDDDSDNEASQLPVDITHDANEEDEDDPFAAFGFSAVKNANSLMSPTQAFHATMQTPSQATQQDSLDILNYLAPPSSTTQPFTLETLSESQASIVPASQVSASQQVALGWETQAPETPVPALHRGESNVTIETPGWEPTQDAGLPASWQIGENLEGLNSIDSIVNHDTQSTVRLRISESPVSAPKRTRLIRGQRVAQESSDEDDETHVRGPDVQQRDAFREMAKRRKEALTAAERAEAEREAKQMMDEQAEESEDEYAGLGGDDFVAPETEEDREMIDSSHIEIDEREMAAHHAEKQRLSDEAAASKLYKDLMTGALRRKQANMFDLDEDEDDLALRRRQMRQREEARKRKLLLQDDNIAGLAEGKQSMGKDAFLKAIADDDERDDDLLDLSDLGEGEDDVPTDSQPSQQQESSTQALREVSGNKRRLEDTAAERPPAKARRTQASAFRAPTSLLEVQQSVSFLLEEAHALPAGPSTLDISSDSENEDAESDATEDEVDELEAERKRLNDGGFIPDQVKMPPPRLPASQRRTTLQVNVVDRLSLKRTASATESAHARTAWAAPAGGVGFKVPSLLRRATTSIASGANERGVTTSNGMSRENSGVKMGGSKKSSLAYQARAEERSAIVEASAKRRAENTAKIAKLRRNASSGFGRDMAGRFE
jgi:mediator of replication checkpoint protein 1